MLDGNPTSRDRANLSERIGELVQRWLPMVLRRVGVPMGKTVRLRRAIEGGDEGLRELLDFAHEAVAQQSTDPATVTDFGPSVLEIIHKLQHALDLGNRDVEAAQRCVDDVHHELLGLVVGAPTSPRTRRGGAGGLGADASAVITWSNWWWRLIARDSAMGGLVHR